MSIENNYAVLMAGGIGSRFWPMSRTQKPKQFLDILGLGKSLIQLTFERLKRFTPAENIYIVTNEDYIELVKEQLPELLDSQILSEPVRRNTAPCVAYAAYKIHQKNPNANLVVAPSDHLILKEEEFERCILKAINVANEQKALVTLGINPSRPDTGYGYIQASDVIADSDEDFYKVKTFTEKPTLEIAKTFLESGDFSWNSGIFIWTSATIIEAFQKYLPEMHELFAQGEDKYYTDQESEFIKETYSVCTNISIDYGIMEKSKEVYVMSCDFGWSDLGTWGSLYDHLDHDDAGNAVVGKNVMMYDSKDNIVHVPKEKLVVLQGLNNYIVVESNNTLLVCRKDDEQKIKQFVTDIKIEKDEKFV